MTTSTIALLALFAATAASLFSALTFFRGQQWRNSDDGKAVSSKIAALTDRVTKIETKIEDLPTMAHIARLTAVSESNGEGIRILRDGVRRIEDFLMERSK